MPEIDSGIECDVIMDISSSEIMKKKEISVEEKEKIKGLQASILDLSKCEIIPFVPLSKNDNSEEARLIREYKNNVGNLELIEYVKKSKIDLSKLDSGTQEMYENVKTVDIYHQEIE